MAKKLPPEEMVKITLDTSTMQDIDPETKLPLGTFKFILKDLEKDLGTFERALQSSTNFFEFFSNSLKKIDKDSGLAQQSFYIRKSELDNAMTALVQTNQKVATVRESELGYNISAEEAELVTGKRTLHGKYAQKKAMQELEKYGGTMTADPKHKDKFDISIPFAKSELEGLSDKEKSSLINKAMPNARKLSNIENRKISAEKKEKERKALEQEEARKKKEEEKAQAEQARNKKKRETEQKKEQQASAHKRLAVTKAVFATLVILTDITRRILSNMFKQAQKNDRDSVSAHTVGLTLAQKRNLDTFDVAHGLEAGDSFQAIQVIQQKWGDVTNLDEEGLGVLARVMGSKVGDFVNSGMGGKNPDKLFDMILDDFFKQYLDGKNSLGQEVGRAQARRELTTVLAGVSPEIAKVFERMIDDLESGYYKKFTNATEWRATTPVNTKGLTEAEDKYSAQLGKVYNEILADFKQFRESFLERLLIDCNELLYGIRNLRLNEAPEVTMEVDAENRQANEENDKLLKNKNKTLAQSVNVYTNKWANTRQKQLKEQGRVLKSAPYFGYSAEILADIQSGELTAQKAFDSRDKKGNNIYGLSDMKQAKDFIARGKVLYQEAMFDTTMQDVFARMYAVKILREKIDKTRTLSEGEKIPKVDVTDARINQLAQDYLEKTLRKAVQTPSMYNAFGVAHENMLDLAVGYFKRNSQAQGILLKNFGANQDYVSEKKRYMTDTSGFYADREKALSERFSGQDLALARVVDIMLANSGDNGAQWFEAYKGLKVALEAEFVRQPILAMDESVSKIEQAIVSKLSGVTAGVYNVEAKQGKSGEVVVKLISDKGRYDFNFANTKVGKDFKATAYVHPDGTMTLENVQNLPSVTTGVNTNPSRNASQ